MTIDVLLEVGIKSPFQRRKPKKTILLKKQVKFTDDLKSCSDVMTTGEGGEKLIVEIQKVGDESNPLKGEFHLEIDYFYSSYLIK
jgi:hypothetical protein